MSISYLKLKKIAYFCLLLPAVLFVVGFLKWYIGIPVALLCAVAYYFIIKDTKKEADIYADKVLRIKPLHFIILVGIVTLWCYLSGLGNLYYQSDDWFARNAIFRDLIREDWPVIYNFKDAALVYYIGYWLPPALVGKIIYNFTNLSIAWTVGNIVLWLWSVICVTVVILMTMVFLNANTKKRFWTALAIFIGFSGLDIVGTLFMRIFNGVAIPNHIEWWTTLQYSSMVTVLGWVFNQAIFSWMATICFLSEKKTRNYAFIICCALSSSPMPCVGLAIYMVVSACVMLWRAIKEKRVKEFWLDVFTVQNIVPVLTLLPIYFFYYKSNVAVNLGSGSGGGAPMPRDLYAIILLSILAACFAAAGLWLRRKNMPWQSRKLFVLSAIAAALAVLAVLDPGVRLNYLAFILLESIVFLVVIWDDHKTDPVFYASWALTLICPLITVGTAADFCMRASIPLVFVLMVMSTKYLLDNAETIKQKGASYRKVTSIILIALLVIGVFTAYKEFERGVVEIIRHKQIALVNDWVGTFSKIFPSGLDKNFIAASYEDTFFFRYLAK